MPLLPVIEEREFEGGQANGYDEEFKLENETLKKGQGKNVLIDQLNQGKVELEEAKEGDKVDLDEDEEEEAPQWKVVELNIEKQIQEERKQKEDSKINILK